MKDISMIIFIVLLTAVFIQLINIQIALKGAKKSFFKKTLKLKANITKEKIFND